MFVIFVLFALLVVGLASLTVCSVMARQSARNARKREAVAARLDSIVARAEREHRDRKAAAQASAALTTVLPAINPGDRAPRRVA